MLSGEIHFDLISFENAQGSFPFVNLEDFI